MYPENTIKRKEKKWKKEANLVLLHTYPGF